MAKVRGAEALTIDVDFAVLIGGKYLPSLPGFSWRAALLRAQFYPFGSFTERLLACRQGRPAGTKEEFWEKRQFCSGEQDCGHRQDPKLTRLIFTEIV